MIINKEYLHVSYCKYSSNGKETGFNISLITLTKKLMEQASRCEEVLQ